MQTILNINNLEYMRNCKDKEFDLAIVDPPYGVEEMTGKEFCHGRGKLKHRVFNKGADKIDDWDKPPTEEYWKELFRISKYQIIWGGNYFPLPPYRCVVVWDKVQPFPNFSAVEIAWTNFNEPSKLFKFDNRYSGKIHPTQKPVELYEYLLKTFAKKGWKILDTHLGSGSSAIACYNLGYEFVGLEIDKDYYEGALKRLEEVKSKPKLFRNTREIKKQDMLF